MDLNAQSTAQVITMMAKHKHVKHDIQRLSRITVNSDSLTSIIM